MTILIVTQTFPLNPSDSTAHFMYDFAKGFLELNHKVLVVVPFHPKLKTNSFKGITIIPFRYIYPDPLHLLGFGRTLKANSSLPYYAYLLAPFYALFCAIAIFRTVKKYKVDVINSHWLLPNGFITSLISLFTNIPLFITIPGSDAYISRKNLLFNLLAKLAVFLAKDVISNSPQLLAYLKIKGKIIPYGVAENTGRRLIHKGVTVAGAGRPVEKKGFQLLEKAYPNAEIISNLPNNLLLKRLLAIDIFVAPSIPDSEGNVDGSPVVLCEAMAAGCAVVATDLPGNRVVIKQNIDGILIKPRLTDIKNAIERLCLDPKLRRRLGKTARKSVSEHFRRSIIANSYISCFK